MDIRPGQSPGNIFASAEANPLGQSGLSFDEESPDSVLNPDGSVGYLAARLSKERGATAERLKTLTAMEQRGGAARGFPYLQPSFTCQVGVGRVQLQRIAVETTLRGAARSRQLPTAARVICEHATG